MTNLVSLKGEPDRMGLHKIAFHYQYKQVRSPSNLKQQFLEALAQEKCVAPKEGPTAGRTWQMKYITMLKITSHVERTTVMRWKNVYCDYFHRKDS